MSKNKVIMARKIRFDDASKSYQGYEIMPRIFYSLLEKRKFTEFEASNDLLRHLTGKGEEFKFEGKTYQLSDDQKEVAYSFLAKRWLWSVGSVRHLLSKMEEWGVIWHEIIGVEGSKKSVITNLTRGLPQKRISMVISTGISTGINKGIGTDKPIDNQKVTNLLETGISTGISMLTETEISSNTNSTNNLLKEEEEKEGFYDKKFPSKKMAYDAAKFIERKIVNGELEKVSKKIETSKADLQILLSEFRSYYETLEGRFFINDNAKSEKSVLAVFSSFVESKIKSDINTSNNLKSSNEPNWNANKTISLMKTIWECEHPTRILSNGDKNHFGEILKSINKIIKGKRAAEGLLGYTPSDEEKINIWTNFVKNMPNFLLEGNYSFKFIASDFPNLQRQSETEGQKVVQLNDFEFKAQMLRDFYTANDENEQKMMRMKFASGLSNESLKPIINDFIKSHKSWDKDADLNKIHLDLIRFINSLRVDGYIDYEITRKEESMLMKQGVIFQKRRAAII